MIHASKHWFRFVTLATFVLLLLSSILIARAEVRREFDDREFLLLLHDMDQLERGIQGCPTNGYPPEVECAAGASHFDAARWKKICDRGHKLFGGK